MVFLFCQSVADGIDVALLPGRPSQSMPTAGLRASTICKE
jgi:hypothetical protein